MVNPAFPKNQVVGVYSLELARMYGYLYQNTDVNFSILHALDGYDEISLTGGTKLISNNSESLLEPQDLGLIPLKAEEISGGNSIESAAGIFLEVLKGEGTLAQNNVVCANAGIAIATVKKIDIKEGFALAQESLVSGNALASFKALQELSYGEA